SAGGDVFFNFTPTLTFKGFESAEPTTSLPWFKKVNSSLTVAFTGFSEMVVALAASFSIENVPRFTIFAPELSCRSRPSQATEASDLTYNRPVSTTGAYVLPREPIVSLPPSITTPLILPPFQSH